jgi:AraC-like DNA-binding protein
VSDPGAAVGPGSSAVLRTALEQVRLEGAIFFRTELTESFAVGAEPNGVAPLLHPGASRLILFHIVVDGDCWVSSDDGVRLHAQAGDVIVLPYGHDHTIGAGDDTECVSILTLIDPPPWDSLPVVRYGGGGPRVDIVCGYLHSEDPLFDPALRVFPPAFVVRLPEGTASGWVQASIAFAGEGGTVDDDPLRRRLPELVLIEVLRLHLAQSPAAASGWLAALRDPVLAPALALLHADPARKWTVPTLAAEAAVSRSLLDSRFRQVLGLSPIRYLTDWRIHLAQDLLGSSTLGVGAVARRVGYDSDESFSRAFKRATGQSPSQWRAER